MVTSINFLLTISIDCQEIRLWELVKSSPKRKCFDFLSNSLNKFFKDGNIERSVWRICVWILGLKGLSHFWSRMRLVLRVLTEGKPSQEEMDKRGPLRMRKAYFPYLAIGSRITTAEDYNLLLTSPYWNTPDIYLCLISEYKYDKPALGFNAAETNCGIARDILDIL